VWRKARRARQGLQGATLTQVSRQTGIGARSTAPMTGRSQSGQVPRPSSLSALLPSCSPLSQNPHVFLAVRFPLSKLRGTCQEYPLFSDLLPEWIVKIAGHAEVIQETPPSLSTAAVLFDGNMEKKTLPAESLGRQQSINNLVGVPPPCLKLNSDGLARGLQVAKIEFNKNTDFLSKKVLRHSP